MQIQHVGYRLKGFYRLGSYALRQDLMPDAIALHRQKVLDFCTRHGLAATLEAFAISRRTLYRWKSLSQAQGIAALAPASRAPHGRRRRRWPAEVIQRIRFLRTQLPNLGKAQLQVLLIPWCAERQLPCPSESTIGRLIHDAPDRMRLTPPALTAKGHPKPFRRENKPRRPKHYRPQALGECLGMDAIERRLQGLKRYLLTSIDEVSGYAIALAVPRLNSQQSAHFLHCTSRLMPFPVRQIITDNGSEFKKHFDQALADNGIQHLWTYPHTPKMNAVCERFNRTIQEQFVDFHEDLLFNDLDRFNQKLADWLVLYNSVRPHKGKQLRTPVQVILQHQPQCHMWWTHTNSCVRKSCCCSMRSRRRST